MEGQNTLLGPIAILKQAWSIFTEKWTTLLGIMVLPLVFGMLIVIGGVYGLRLGYAPVAGGIVLIIFGVVAAIISSWAQISLISALKNPTEYMSIAEAYKLGWEKIFSYWWISILLTLIFIGSYVLAFIPGIIFTVWFVFAPFVLVIDEKRGMNALLHSKSLVRGRWWGVFGRLILIGLITMLTYVAISFVLRFALGFAGMAGIFIGMFSDPIINLVVMSYCLTAVSVLYKSLKASAVTPAPVEKRGLFVGFAIWGLVVTVAILASVLMVSTRMISPVDELRTPEIYPY